MGREPDTQAALTPCEVFTRFQAATLKADAAAMADLYAEDALMEFPFALAGTERRIHGRDQIYDQELVGMTLTLARYPSNSAFGGAPEIRVTLCALCPWHRLGCCVSLVQYELKGGPGHVLQRRRFHHAGSHA
jgi:hypothetical protein